MLDGLKKNWDKGILSYAVGAMLYAPALHETIADSILARKIAEPYSLTLCLEDSIGDHAVEAAEAQLLETLGTLQRALQRGQITPKHLPLIFIRVRTPAQLEQLAETLTPYTEFLAGFVFPKFSVAEADNYITCMQTKYQTQPLFMLPILESDDIISPYTRAERLYQIKEKLDKVSHMVLNIRVGGNDFCNRFGVRRHWHQTIYDIGAVSNLLADIITVFASDYVVSGPVWEYFGDQEGHWKTGLEREASLDMLNGFVGKTVIHPEQIPVVNQCLQPVLSDYQDALHIKHWDESTLGVAKSGGGRMNEKKTHMIWADKVLKLAEIYGVRENG